MTVSFFKSCRMAHAHSMDLYTLDQAKNPLLRLSQESQGRISAFEPRESTRQVEGLFESLLAQSFDGGR